MRSLREITTLRARPWEAGLLMVVALPYVAFFALSWGRVGPKDFDQFLVFHELQYWNWSLVAAAKQWSPVLCSGVSLAGEPQVPFASLSMLLAYVLGPLAGIQIATCIYVILGFVGGVLYAGLWLARARERLLAAALFVGNPFVQWRLAVGQVDFLPFFLLPLLLWGIHASARWPREGTACQRWSMSLGGVLLAGALVAMSIDGAPVVVAHLLFWIVLYVLVLSIVSRDAVPLLFASIVLLIACALDAGYLWPMLRAQQMFPRLTPDRHTMLPGLLFHAYVPLRGKILPAVNGKGHELTIFVGPFLAWILWRYRRALPRMPARLGIPLLVVSTVSVVLGMGSLRSLHVPVWLSPFDLLRPLPGFRSLEVTARYWGILCIPLTLYSAWAICRFLDESPPHPRRAHVMSLLLLLQLTVASEALISSWRDARPYRASPIASVFRGGAQRVEYVLKGPRLQGELITPTRGVLDCYDHDDFVRASFDPGDTLIAARFPIEAGFENWSTIAIRWDPAVVPAGLGSERLTVNQAWHPFWRSDHCRIGRDASNRIELDCSATDLRAGFLRLRFFDAVADRAATISRSAWCAWLVSVAGWMTLTVGGALLRRRGS